MSEPKLAGKRIAFLACDNVQTDELKQPWQAVIDAGGEADLISPDTGTITGTDDTPFEVDHAIGDADAADYDCLVLPGGVKNSDHLRMNGDSVRFTRAFFDAGKPVAAICHGPWMLVEADVVTGRTLTSYPSLKTDIKNAGGSWVDQEVVVDKGLVTSRDVNDLDAFCAKVVEEACEGVHPGQRRSTVGAS